MLHKHGLESKRDYTVIESPLPSMPAVLLEKKAALVPIVLPFAFNPKLKAGGKVLFTQDQALGKTQMLIFAARESFIKAHRAAMVDFMTDLLRVVHWYLDPKNHAAAEEIASKLTKVPASRFGWLFTKQDNYRDPNMVPDLAALQRNVDTVQQLGFVKKHLDIKSHSDLSLLHEAIARLKKSNGK
ncbi:MAG: ABC transporter substrate-binding protein, partial [Bradyrhizobium sp.]